MAPTLTDGDVVLVNWRARPRPGSVVLACWPWRPRQLSIKRVVGRHGDGWWVLGDNPDGSTDSRQLGSAQVVAVAVARLWPAPRWLLDRRPRGVPGTRGGCRPDVANR